MSKLKEFTEFVKMSCSPGSNLPGSYMRALRYVTKFLNDYVPQYASLPPVWEIDSLDVIEELYVFLKAEEKKGEASVFYRSELPKSYLKHRYCTNALKTFGRFLSSTKMEDEAISIYKSTNEAESVARGIATIRISKPSLFLDDGITISSREGKETLRQVRQRQNQSIFRRMVMANYNNVCCITGLPVRAALRASHIIGWSEDKSTRLLPTNGLCLAATYDAAFDRHLISFDEDYRMIIAPSLKEYFTNDAFIRVFKDFEGRQIARALRFQPSQEFLQRHREQMK